MKLPKFLKKKSDKELLKEIRKQETELKRKDEIEKARFERNRLEAELHDLKKKNYASEHPNVIKALEGGKKLTIEALKSLEGYHKKHKKRKVKYDWI